MRCSSYSPCITVHVIIDPLTNWQLQVNMVSSILVDALNNPTQALLELYDTGTNVDTFPQKVSEHFARIFDSIDAFREVPL